MDNMLETHAVEPNGNGHHNGHEHCDPLEEETIVLEPEEAAPKAVEPKRKRKPLWPLLVVAVVFVVGVAVVLFVVYGLAFSTTEVAATIQTQAPAADNATQRQEADKIADKLVNSTSVIEARKDAPAEPQPGAAGAPVPGVDKSVTLQAGDGAGVPPGAAGTVPSQAQGAQAGADRGAAASSPQPAFSAQTGTAAPASSGPRLAALPPSSASAQQSFRYAPGPGPASGPRDARDGAGSRGSSGDAFDNTYSFNGRPGADASRGAANAAAPAPVVPPFGSMLPVRSLGALHTLRSGGSVRLELARDVRGRGWSLARGTVLVATLNGSDVDRAFLTVTGYIHPTTGALVRFTGDVMGDDGGSGLKGKRRTLGSARARAVAEVLRSGRDLLQSVIAGRSGGTTIINGQDPLSTEVDGLRSRNQNREFVEVQAGTYGYVMVKDLPAEVEGQQPASAPIQPGQLSDEEVAALLASGTAEQIRAALP